MDVEATLHFYTNLSFELDYNILKTTKHYLGVASMSFNVLDFKWMLKRLQAFLYKPQLCVGLLLEADQAIIGIQGDIKDQKRHKTK